MRERTYWPELCVVQLAGAAEVAVVDAQSPGIDLAPLAALFADRAVPKVFHAARQDIEIFVLRFDAVPVPLFDTQVAAMVAGFGDQVGYDSLVAALTGAHIDKAHRFSDWSVRPLSPAQIDVCGGGRDASAAGLREAARTAGTRRPARMGRRGNGGAGRPRDLSARSGNDVGAAASAHQQPAHAGRAAGDRGVARAGGAAQQHSARAHAEGRGAAGDRGDRAGYAGGAGARPRRQRGVRARQDRRGPAGRHRRGQGADRRTGCRTCRTAATGRGPRRRWCRC